MTKKNYEELIYKRENLTYQLSYLEGEITGFDCYKEDIKHCMKVEILLATVFLLFVVGLVIGGCIGIKNGYEAMIVLPFMAILPGACSWYLSIEAVKDYIRFQKADEDIEETRRRFEALQCMYKNVDKKIKEAEKKNGKRTKTTKTTNK